MLLFPQYRPSERTARQHIRTTRRMGLVPVLIAAALIYAKSFRAGPGVWAALGLALGLQLLLGGAQSLSSTASGRTRAATYLALTADRWFPVFLFAAQTAFVLIVLALLWLSLAEVGLPASPWRHANVAALALLIQLSRLANEGTRFHDSVKLGLAERFIHYLCIILAATWLVTTLISFLAPPGEQPVEEYFPLIIALWVGESIVILVCVVLFLDLLARIRKKSRAA